MNTCLLYPSGVLTARCGDRSHALAIQHCTPAPALAPPPSSLPYSRAPLSSNIAAMSINQKLEEALNNQVIAEHQAALVYTQLAYELDRLSLTGMSTWMFAQADEEREHAQRFADHLSHRDARGSLKRREPPGLRIGGAPEAIELSLEPANKW